MSHKHHFNPIEARASPVDVTTKVQYVTVTANSPTPAVSPARSVGNPVLGSSSAQESSMVTPTYHAPVRHHRPTHTQSKSTAATTSTYHAPVRHHHPTHVQSNSAHRTKGSPKLSETSQKGSQPTPQHHHHNHHSAGRSSQTSKSSFPQTPQQTGSTNALDQNDGASNLQKSTNSDTMSGGAKAGLAIGLILALALIGVLIFVLYRRRKNQNAGHQPLDDEKSHHKSNGSIASHVSVRRTVANAPRLSLRPVTEMFPSMSEKQEHTSASTLIANSAASARGKAAETSSKHDKSSNQTALDPFADNHEAINDAELNTPAAPNTAIPKPLSIKSERTGNFDQVLPSVAHSTDASDLLPNNKRLSPPGPGPNNVHRVQLDFNPSMDDELGLRAGQLVRMLHEYDDGWALCIRLDRSQQGVVPRTCISKLPVKPRPQGPPPSVRAPPQGRPRGASNGTSTSRGPPQDARQRTAAPPNGRYRSQSSGPQHAGLISPETSAVHPANGDTFHRGNADPVPERQMTPNASDSRFSSTSPVQGGGVLNRKPVPGQAC